MTPAPRRQDRLTVPASAGGPLRFPLTAPVVWGVAVGAYVVAVLHRSSLGVAGVEAVDRFGLTATVLSTLVVVQLGMYAAMQVPMGMLLDRWGSRALISAGALLMGAGQLLLATATDLGPAVGARVLIGAGDAATFISVIRLVALWFPAHRAALFTQLTGLVGQLGQVAAAVPLVALLHVAGWGPAFGVLAAVGALTALLVWWAVRDAPDGRRPAAPEPGTSTLRPVLRAPVTWLGFFTHSVTQFSATVFVLLWGFPFLTRAQGLTPAQAGALLTLNVVAALLAGPVIGVLTGRHPLRRSWMVLAVAFAVATAWATVLLRPGPSPLWLLAVFVVVLGVGGPGSAIGFDYVRTGHPPQRLGTASGVVNVGGFSTAVVSVLAVGLVLDAQAARGVPPLSLDAFRVAFAVLAVPWALGVAGVLVTRRAARRELAAHGVVVPPVREALARHRAARRAPAAVAPDPSPDG